MSDYNEIDTSDTESEIEQTLSECRKRQIIAHGEKKNVFDLFVSAAMMSGTSPEQLIKSDIFNAYKVGNCLFTFLWQDAIFIQLWEVRRGKATAGATNLWNKLGSRLAANNLTDKFVPVGPLTTGMSDGIEGFPDPPDVEKYDKSPSRYVEEWRSTNNLSSNAASAKLIAQIAPQLSAFSDSIAPQSLEDIEVKLKSHLEEIERQRQREKLAFKFTFRQYADAIWDIAISLIGSDDSFDSVTSEDITKPVGIPDKDWDGIPLSGNKRKIAALWRNGKTSGEIARTFRITTKTVNNLITELRNAHGTEIIPYHKKK